MSLEACIEWIDDDEWIEITPEDIRIRKKVLPANMRSIKEESNNLFACRRIFMAAFF